MNFWMLETNATIIEPMNDFRHFMLGRDPRGQSANSLWIIPVTSPRRGAVCL